jgi:hypothetical protein
MKIGKEKAHSLLFHLDLRLLQLVDLLTDHLYFLKLPSHFVIRQLDKQFSKGRNTWTTAINRPTGAQFQNSGQGPQNGRPE